MKHINKRGASLTGYGLVVGLIAVVGIGAITSIGGEVDGLFSTVGGELDGVVNDANSALPQASASPSAIYEFTSHTFTSCGQTGVDGPSLSDCQTAYSSAPWAANTSFFNITSAGVQEWQVPDTGTYRVTLNGAEGGQSKPQANPGLGGRVIGDISLTEGDTLYILVGQKGEGFDLGGSGSQYFTAGGFNGGGGTGYPENDCNNCSHASGGGASDIRLGGNSLNDRVMVAGGGGGGTTEQSSTTDLRDGGDGGGLTGADGQGSGNNSTSAQRGQGGTPSSGGNAGGGGQAGSFGQGGRADRNDAGGGGGGWYGGGGGGSNGSGGGGSSYTDAVLVSNVTHTQGANSGDGSITIELLP